MTAGMAIARHAAVQAVGAVRQGHQLVGTARVKEIVRSRRELVCRTIFFDGQSFQGPAVAGIVGRIQGRFNSADLLQFLCQRRHQFRMLLDNRVVCPMIRSALLDVLRNEPADLFRSVCRLFAVGGTRGHGQRSLGCLENESSVFVTLIAEIHRGSSHQLAEAFSGSITHSPNRSLGASQHRGDFVERLFLEIVSFDHLAVFIRQGGERNPQTAGRYRIAGS